jgi:glycosyltransferase involved in cell wall biosynthesis
VSGLVAGIEGSAEVIVITREGEASEGVTVLDTRKGLFILKTLQHLRDLNPDVIHCHSHWHMLAPAVVYKRFHKDVKVIFTFHTEPVAPMKGAKSNIFGKLLNRCDAVTFVSRSLLENISSQIRIQSQGTVIHPGFHAGTASTEEVEEFKTSHGFDNDGPTLVFTGLLEWLDKVEGVKVLVEALTEVKKTYPNLRLLLVGDGSRRGEVQKVVEELSLSDSVTITGLVENVFAPLALSDIYVHITMQEGLPQAILEAMSIGKPVIAANVGGIPEVVRNGENGILVDPDVKSVQLAIEDLLDHPSKADQLGRQGKGDVESEFTWEKASERFLRLYSDR